MQKLIRLSIFSLLLIPDFSGAQNTIGGVQTLVPEAEVKRQSQFLNAERERLLGRWDKALEAYKEIVFDYPDNDAAWYGLARTWSAKDDVVNAANAIAQAVKLSPENQWYILYQADLYERNGRNRDALETYEAIVRKFPDNPEYHEKLAYLALLNEDPRRALKALDKLESLQGITAKSTAQKHLIYKGLGDMKKAAEVYIKLVSTYPENPDYRHQLADFYEQSGDKAAARKVWEETLQKFPDDPLARISLAQATGGTDAQYLASVKPLFGDPKVGIDAKIKDLMPFLSRLESGKDPSLANSLTELGAILEKTHPDEAKAWSVSGDILYLSGNDAGALEKYKRCIQLNAGVFSVWRNALNILESRKDFPEMMDIAEKALDLFPNQPEAYLLYGQAANGLKKHDDALAQLNQAVLMTGNNAPLRARILECAGDAWLGKGNREKARESYRKALEIASNPELQQKLNGL
ncbi:MAG: tetratricopeptide repeat protein [Bacteroidota bacterium]